MNGRYVISTYYDGYAITETSSGTMDLEAYNGETSQNSWPIFTRVDEGSVKASPRIVIWPVGTYTTNTQRPDPCVTKLLGKGDIISFQSTEP